MAAMTVATATTPYLIRRLIIRLDSGEAIQPAVQQRKYRSIPTNTTGPAPTHRNRSDESYYRPPDRTTPVRRRQCLAGLPGSILPPAVLCGCFDFVDEGDVDLADFQQVQHFLGK
jgi:hypothetical protein